MGNSRPEGTSEQLQSFLKFDLAHFLMDLLPALIQMTNTRLAMAVILVMGSKPLKTRDAITSSAN
jgi:hypothetical protein